MASPCPCLRMAAATAKPSPHDQVVQSLMKKLFFLKVSPTLANYLGIPLTAATRDFAPAFEARQGARRDCTALHCAVSFRVDGVIDPPSSQSPVQTSGGVRRAQEHSPIF
jgi:hypothetical protein